MPVAACLPCVGIQRTRISSPAITTIHQRAERDDADQRGPVVAELLLAEQEEQPGREREHPGDRVHVEQVVRPTSDAPAPPSSFPRRSRVSTMTTAARPVST